jgi:hypothetical protein
MTVRPLPVLAAACVLGLTGLAHGIRSDRWRVGAEVQAAAARLQKLPVQVGDWDGRAVDVTADEIRVAQMAGHYSQKFSHRISAEEASMLLLCGRPGAIGSHTPDLCYQGLGFQMEGQPVRQQVRAGGQTAEFWTALFKRTDPVPQTIRIWWAWSVTGEWKASDSPRLTYAYYPAIYKIYAVSNVREGEKLEDNAARKLLEAMLPELASTLSSSP